MDDCKIERCVNAQFNAVNITEQCEVQIVVQCAVCNAV